MTAAALRERMDEFTRRCAEAGLASTHQRWVIYRVLAESEDHPSPETVYERVRREIPSISQATVYKNIHTFVELGLLAEVRGLRQTSRLDANLRRHHHLVCVRCEKVTDFYDEALDQVRASQPSPRGFRVLRYRIEAEGLCPECRAKELASDRD